MQFCGVLLLNSLYVLILLCLFGQYDHLELKEGKRMVRKYHQVTKFMNTYCSVEVTLRYYYAYLLSQISFAPNLICLFFRFVTGFQHLLSNQVHQDINVFTVTNEISFCLVLQDLQVKSSLPAQPTPPINNDPAIIQVKNEK